MPLIFGRSSGSIFPGGSEKSFGPCIDFLSLAEHLKASGGNVNRRRTLTTGTESPKEDKMPAELSTIITRLQKD
ncbi:MAG: hypothetical protein V3T72_09135, partial [Thermoanaerobaculia bacterium]